MKRGLNTFINACFAGIDHIIPAGRYLFLRIYFNHVMLYCSALSYSLFVAFIPLIASLSLFASKIYKLNQTKIDIFLNQKEISALILKFLPYSSHELNIYILKLLKNATTIGWIGTAGLFLSVILLYGTLEEIFNDAWKVKQGRPVYKNIGMVIWITFLFTLLFGLSVKLGKAAILRKFLPLLFLGKMTAFGILILSFSMLYKLIPAIKVRWRAALTGGLFAAVAYQLCRAGLHIYITRIFAHNKIWGSLILIPIFVLTIYMLSLIIVLGNEVSCLAQNYREFTGLDEKNKRKKPYLVAFLEARKMRGAAKS